MARSATLRVAPDLHGVTAAMREYDDEDPREPQSVWIARKPSNPAEAFEAVPCRKDDERDRHRHVV